MSIIAIDIDEVLSDTMSAFVAFNNERYGTNLKREDFFSYHFEDVLGIPTAEVVTRLLQFYLEDPIEIHPMPGAREVLEQLGKRYSLVAITARITALEGYTREWMDREYPNIFSEIHFAHNVHVGCDRKMKHDYCLELGAKALVDDTIEYLQPCPEHGIQAFLFHQPWNKHAEAAGVRRVYSWEDVRDRLL